MRKFYITLLACMVGMSAWALEPVDGVYQLSSTEDFIEFAALINEGAKDVKAVLTADIDLTEQPTLMVGETWQNAFTGEFDGQGHTIKLAISVENTGNYSGALFHYVENATFKNLNLTGSVATCGKHPASLASAIRGNIVLSGVTSDCDIFSNGGDTCMGGLIGIAGENGDNAAQTELVFNNCAFSGSITHTGDINQNHGGNFVGWKGNKNTIVFVNNSYAAPKSIDNSGNFSTFVRFWGSNDNGQIFVKDSYYINEITNYVAFQGTEAIRDQFKSGEVCYFMNSMKTEGQMWFQNIGEDEFPVMDSSHKTVYAQPADGFRCDGLPIGETTFTNTPVSIGVPSHNYEDGICSFCGTPDENFAEKDADGFVLLDNCEKVIWFAAMVEKVNNALNAKLTEDIDMSMAGNFVMIGSDAHPYCGTFDGQDHIISNLVVEKEQDFVGFFSTVIGGAHITHLILDNTCNIFSTGCRVGMVGAAHGKGDVYIDYCGNEGNVSSTSTYESTAAGIFGCNVDCLGDIHIDHCYSTGVITGINQSAQIAGWLNYYGNSSMTNCWSIAEVTGYDNEGAAMARHSGQKLQNNFSTYSQGIQFTPDQLQSGELCYRMNGSTLKPDPVWYQTVGQDDFPTWKADHGFVFKVGEGEFDSMQDDADFPSKRGDALDYEATFTEELIATQAMIDDFNAYLTELAEMEFADFLEAFSHINELKDGLNQSAQAYTTYMNKVDEVKLYLEENPGLSGTYLDFLKGYLEQTEAPGTYPNGTYLYIVENRQLTTEEVQAETEYVELLRRQAVEGGYVKDSDISNLLVNAEFANWYEGWEQTLNCSRNSDVIEGRHISETWNGPFDIHQTVTGLKPGIYEVQIQASYRPAFQPTSTNLSGMIYMNDQNVYIMSSYEGMISAEDAIDRENSYLNMEDDLHDMIVYDTDGETILGYVPRGTTGAYYAYKGGRYWNSLVCQVGEDGQLTVGIKDPGTGASEDETAWAEMKLIYRGTVEEATAAIDETLANMAARAQTLLDYQCDVNFTLYPNFGNELREGLKALIEAVMPGTYTGVLEGDPLPSTTGEEKYYIVNSFSEIFRQVYASKQAYIAYDKACNQYVDELGEMAIANPELDITDAVNAAYNIMDKLLSGVYTIEEALAQEELKALPYYSAIFGVIPELVDGVYQIASYDNLAWLHKQINLGNTGLSVALTTDIDLSSYPTFMLAEDHANPFTGVFDGQGHTIKLATNVTYTGNYSGALFRHAYTATFKNLNLTGSVTTTGKHPASLVSLLWGPGVSTIENVTSDCDIFTNAGDACMSGLVGIVGDVWNDGGGADIIFNNCGFTGNITHTGNAASDNHGGSFVGWKACNNARITMNNCYAAPKSVNSPRFGTYVRYLDGSDNGQIYTNNSYFLSGVVDYWAKQGEEKTAEEFANGSVCFLLNGDQSDIVWYQAIGTDAYPVLNASHGKVVKNEDGSYSTVTGVESLTFSQGEDAIYDLSGRRVEKMQKGIYIINGKKIAIK